MKYGLICPICDRLLWTREGRFPAGEPLASEGVFHGESGRKAKPTDEVFWCGCKPARPARQQDLAEPR